MSTCRELHPGQLAGCRQQFVSIKCINTVFLIYVITDECVDHSVKSNFSLTVDNQWEMSTASFQFFKLFCTHRKLVAWGRVRLLPWYRCSLLYITKLLLLWTITQSTGLRGLYQLRAPGNRMLCLYPVATSLLEAGCPWTRELVDEQQHNTGDFSSPAQNLTG